MRDVTVVYYTSNTELPVFEANVQRAILRDCGSLPIISVSQKPIDFGYNVCVGDVGISAHNAWRQLQVGAIEAHTKFICTCEADSLHGPDYFHFEPELLDIFYVGSPLYVLFAQRGKSHVFYQKAPQESSIFVGREYLIRRLDEILDSSLWLKPEECKMSGVLAPLNQKVIIDFGIPIITFKTDQNMHRKTPFSRASGTRELPYWGSSDQLITRMFT